MFVTRPEYDDTSNIFDIRIAMLERTMEVSNAENYCQGKVDVMLERELEWVMCNQTKYMNINGKAIAVTNSTIT